MTHSAFVACLGLSIFAIHAQIWHSHGYVYICINMLTGINSNLHGFYLFLSIIACPHLVARNETVNNELYLYPHHVVTELTDTSRGILTVNCTNSGWPTPRIDWIVDIPDRGIVTRSYELPNYNVTENGQVSLLHCRQCHACYIYTYVQTYYQSHVPVITFYTYHRFLPSCFQA